MQSGVYDQQSLEQAAADLAEKLQPGDAVLLSGPLGAGKSTFARALLRAACRDPALDVPSPSYTLVQSFAARGLTLHHFDLWRLDGPSSLAELGWDEARQGIVIVEWPDRLGQLRPAHALHIVLSIESNDLRRAVVTGWSTRFEKERAHSFPG